MPIKELTIFMFTTLTLTACVMDLETRVDASHKAQFFEGNCASCHGAKGRGYDGPVRDWTPPPDLTLLAQRKGGSFPEIRTLTTIYGTPLHTNDDAVMPEFGAGDLGPTVIVEIDKGVGTPIPAELIAVSEYLKSIQR